MAVDLFRYPFIRSNNYLGAYRLLPSTKAALPILESMEFDVQTVPPQIVNATVADKADTLTATIALQAGASIDGAVVDSPDSLSVVLDVPAAFTGAFSDSPDTLASLVSIPVGSSGAIADQNDTLTATMTAPQGIASSVVDSADTASGTIGAPATVTGAAVDADDTVTGLVGTPVTANATLEDRSDVLTGGINTPFLLNAALNFDGSHWNSSFVWGEDVWGPGAPQNDRLTATFEMGPTIDPPVTGGNQSPGDIRPKAPKYMYVFVRPKVERDLDDILEVIDTVQETDRVSENKRKLRVARQALKAVAVPPDYTKAMAGISAALDRVTRSTAKHEGLKQSLAMVSIQLEAVIASLQEKRKKRQREEEELLTWLF